MRFGRSPEEACAEAVKRIVDRDPVAAKDIQVGFVAIAKSGEVGAFAIQKGFTYSVTNSEMNKTLPSKSHFS